MMIPTQATIPASELPASPGTMLMAAGRPELTGIGKPRAMSAKESMLMRRAFAQEQAAREQAALTASLTNPMTAALTPSVPTATLPTAAPVPAYTPPPFALDVTGQPSLPPLPGMPATDPFAPVGPGPFTFTGRGRVPYVSKAQLKRERKRLKSLRKQYDKALALEETRQEQQALATQLEREAAAGMPTVETEGQRAPADMFYPGERPAPLPFPPMGPDRMMDGGMMAPMISTDMMTPARPSFYPSMDTIAPDTGVGFVEGGQMLEDQMIAIPQPDMTPAIIDEGQSLTELVDTPIAAYAAFAATSLLVSDYRGFSGTAVEDYGEYEEYFEGTELEDYGQSVRELNADPFGCGAGCRYDAMPFGAPLDELQGFGAADNAAAGRTGAATGAGLWGAIAQGSGVYFDIRERQAAQRAGKRQAQVQVAAARTQAQRAGFGMLPVIGIGVLGVVGLIILLSRKK